MRIEQHSYLERTIFSSITSLAQVKKIQPERKIHMQRLLKRPVSHIQMQEKTLPIPRFCIKTSNPASNLEQQTIYSTYTHLVMGTNAQMMMKQLI